MSTFVKFREAVYTQLELMAASGSLYQTSTDKALLWNTYLNSFPAGTNLMFRERREYDCTYCNQFIRNIGNVVAIGEDNQLISVWDIQVEGYYQPVVDAMAALVKQHSIVDIYLNDVVKVGVKDNTELDGNGKSTGRTWNHFHFTLPDRFVQRADKIPTLLGARRTNYSMLEQSLRELTLEAGEIVLDLIDQDSLYRGPEKRQTVALFVDTKRRYDAVPADQKNNWLWTTSGELAEKGRFRGDVIGTLLQDISEGKDLDAAVRSFESKVDTTNYQRTTAVITKGMVEPAQKKVAELGLDAALQRRYAVPTDLNVNDLLFAGRSIKQALNVFDDLVKETDRTPPKNLDKVEKISIEDFVKNVLPRATTLDLLLQNRHVNNLFSLVAPVDKTAPSLFPWDNAFSWTYNGEVADSIRERVKKAGGRVEGDVRASLSWSNNDDLDLALHEPDGNVIAFNNRKSRLGGQLDIDMNGMDGLDPNRQPVENIVYASRSRMKTGLYTVVVNQFKRRETIDFGFQLELELMGQVVTFNYPKSLASKQQVVVAKFHYNEKDDKFTIVESIESKEAVKEIWGVKTGDWQAVTLALKSPNFWDDKAYGNLHYFFALEGVANPQDARGFYNEFLKPELKTERKVFEMLGAKLRAKHSPEQVSGLGFSSTIRNSVIVRVGGTFNRVLEVQF